MFPIGNCPVKFPKEVIRDDAENEERVRFMRI